MCDDATVHAQVVVVHNEDNIRPQHLLPGAVLGVELMLRGIQSPCDIRTDPHFEAHIASLSRAEYQALLGAWAASRVRLAAWLALVWYCT